MSEKTVTEREAVRRERSAFIRGVRRAQDKRFFGEAGEDAKALYPLPKITRPRVVVDPNFSAFQWRCVDGRIERRIERRTFGASEWWQIAQNDCAVTPDRIRLWADLLNNPTEEVEDEG